MQTTSVLTFQRQLHPGQGLAARCRRACRFDVTRDFVAQALLFFVLVLRRILIASSHEWAYKTSSLDRALFDLAHRVGHPFLMVAANTVARYGDIDLLRVCQIGVIHDFGKHSSRLAQNGLSPITQRSRHSLVGCTVGPSDPTGEAILSHNSLAGRRLSFTEGTVDGNEVSNELREDFGRGRGESGGFEERIVDASECNLLGT